MPPTLAFYTCFFGNDRNWANVIAPAIDGYDCYYFTNNPKTYERLASTKWIRVWLDLPISDDNLVCSQQSKQLRCCPHEYAELRAYEYLCWIDSKLKFTDATAFQAMLADLETSDRVYAFTRHPLAYKTVWDEFNTAIQYDKYARQKEQYRSYIQSRLQTGYQETPPLRTCCGFHLSKRGSLAEEIGRLWLSEIQACGIEDQISFQFVHQRYDASISLFPYQHCWKYL